MELPKMVLFLGLPGSGKGTQADLLSDRFGFFHFDTGKEIERTVHNQAFKKDPVIQREAVRFDTGLLNTSSWVKELVLKRVRDYSTSGQRLVFSGSPRTLPEAKTLYKAIETLVGKKSALIFFLDIKPATSIYRNSHRRICNDCRVPVIWSEETKNLTFCPHCRGKLIRRVLDKPDIIKERIKEFRRKTAPALKFMEAKGVRVVRVDGEAGPDSVVKNITAHLSGDR